MPTSTVRSPFKFLDAYQKEDKAFFFGREQEIEALYELSFETNLIMLYGASGTGKTSLINCGLSNKFQDTDWFDLFIRRGENLNQSLEKAIREQAVTPIPANIPLRRALKSLFYDYYKPIYLIFDQFEELFILGDKKEQQQFFQTLSELLQLNLQLTVILSMREEYIAYLSDFEKVVPSLFDNRFRVESMKRASLEAVVSGTTKHFHIELEPEEKVVDQILNNLWHKRSGVDLTNLQVYLDRLYTTYLKVPEANRDNMVFTPSLVDRVGELTDVLSDFLDEQLKELENQMPEHKKTVPLDVLFEFVTNDATKRSATVEAVKQELFKKKDISSEDVDFCIDYFSSIRLFRELDE
ncbi:MAG: ATP-binding protein [Bacteroidota bacterium]